MVNNRKSPLMEFVRAMYGNARVKCVNDLRHTKLVAKCGSKKGSQMNPKKNFDMGSLPPCRSCCQEHIKRVNFHVWIWRQAHIPDHALPHPTAGYGRTVENGVMQPKWTAADILPAELVDILEDTSADSGDHSDNEEDDTDSTEDDDNDYESSSCSDGDSDRECII